MQRTALVLVLAFMSVAGSAAAAECKLQKVADLPVTMRGPIPLVSTTIGGVEVLFTVDTGAFFSLISPTAAAKLGLKPHALPGGLTVRGVNGAADVKAVTAKNFKMGGQVVPTIDFLVGGEQIFPGQAGGLIGQNILRATDVEYDLANGMIRLWQPKDCGSSVLSYWNGAASQLVIEPTTVLEPHIQAMVTVNGARLKATFDSGAYGSVLSLRGAARAGVTPQSAGVAAVGATGGLGNRLIETWAAPFAKIGIGDESISNTRLMFGAVSLNDSDMLIGADFFLSHRVYIAYSQKKLYFTYNGGSVFGMERLPARAPAGPPIGPDAAPAAETGPNTPTDAAGFGRRGAAFASRREFPRAIADFTRAVEMEPTNAGYFHQRALARLRVGEPTLALADLNEALRLKPDDLDSLQTRADLYLALRDEGRARADFDTAQRLAPADAGIALRRAGAYLSAERFEAAAGYYADWTAKFPKDSRMAEALNGRCWALAVLNKDLDKAQADCDAALKLRPGLAVILDSRGLVRLRMGRVDEALADYNASLKAQPKAAWTLYARGLVKLKKGDKEGGDADIAAAVAIDPRTADRAKRYGLTS